MSALLQFERITKRFGGVPVLRDITLALPAGVTLGLVGENGAGKSTLMNILGGNLRPDAGHMTWDGQPYAPSGPADAAAAGIAFVHQELNLFPNLSIAENLFLTRFPRRGRWPVIHRRALAAETNRWLREVGLAAPPDTPVERLSAGERQLVEIARALSSEPRLILFDEPTTSLSDRETRQFFTLLERLRARGLTMIYISHTLEDVLRLSDQVAVLRDGALVAHGPREQFDKDRLVTLMVGRRLDRLFPARQPTGGAARQPTAAEGAGAPGQAAPDSGKPEVASVLPQGVPLLEVRGLTRSGVVHDISFELHAGEVLGLFGLMGAGRSELAQILFGLEPFERGSIRVRGRPLASPQPTRCLREGVAFLTENRHEDGLALEASIADNLALVTLRRHARRGTGWLNRVTLADAVRGIREAVRLTPTARDAAPVRTLSGGNQQKVVLGKWLLAQPPVLILDEPTRGIDVGAKFEIYQLIVQRAEAGAGVLLISSELEELIGLCDRILVMRRGEQVDELRRAEFDRERILRAALHERSAA